MDGQCFAFVSDAQPGRDILNASLIKGWIEVDAGQWAVREKAGVIQVGKLADQMASQEEEDVEEETNCTSDDSDESGESPFKKDSNCPVMPVVRKAKDKVVQATKAAGKWVQRLFPQYLGAPDAEDAIPEADNPLFADEDAASEGGCQPDTQDGCNFKEKFYIEKQQKVTAEKRKAELQRLSKMQDVVMKEEQVEWLKARIHILKNLVKKDEL